MVCAPQINTGDVKDMNGEKSIETCNGVDDARAVIYRLPAL
jgi:hypothetical protein